MMLVPGTQTSGSWLSTWEALIIRRVPSWSSLRMVRISTSAMAAMEGRASPRKPMVWRVKRSSAERIFEVAWRAKASRASVEDMPQPLSMTWMSVFPAPLMTIFTCVAPASMAFSTSSLTAEDGRWMTSPAAIWLATESGKSFMTSIGV